MVVPEGLDSGKLEDILHQKAPCILKKKYELDEVEAAPSPKKFVSGEKYAYLGGHYRLKVHKSDNVNKPTLNFRQGRFLAVVPFNITDGEKANKLNGLFIDWYVNQGNRKIEERLKIYCPLKWN